MILPPPSQKNSSRALARNRSVKRGTHQNARLENSRCDMNYIVLPEKHVDKVGFKLDYGPVPYKCGASREFSHINVGPYNTQFCCCYLI